MLRSRGMGTPKRLEGVNRALARSHDLPWRIIRYTRQRHQSNRTTIERILCATRTDLQMLALQAASSKTSPAAIPAQLRRHSQRRLMRLAESSESFDAPSSNRNRIA